MIKNVVSARKPLILLSLSVLCATAWAAPAKEEMTASPGAAATGSTTATVSGQPAAVSGTTVPLESSSVAPPKPRLMDLKPPEIHAVMSAEQLAAAIPNPDENEIVGPETVQVRGATPPPYVPGGFAALYWAATHLSQSWRILVPVQ